MAIGGLLPLEVSSAAKGPIQEEAEADMSVSGPRNNAVLTRSWLFRGPWEH